MLPAGAVVLGAASSAPGRGSPFQENPGLGRPGQSLDRVGPGWCSDVTCPQFSVPQTPASKLEALWVGSKPLPHALYWVCSGIFPKAFREWMEGVRRTKFPCTHSHTDTDRHSHSHAHPRTHVCTQQTGTRTRVHMCSRTRAHVQRSAHIHTRIHARILRCVHTFPCSDTHACTLFKGSPRTQGPGPLWPSDRPRALGRMGLPARAQGWGAASVCAWVCEAALCI